MDAASHQPMPGDTDSPPELEDARTLRAKVLRLVLGANPKHHHFMARVLTAILVYIVTYLVSCYAAYLGLIESRPLIFLGLGFLITTGGFYTLIRSGYSRHFRDPTMSMAQILAATFWSGLSYTVCVPFRGTVLLLLALLLVFGMFNLKAAQQRFVNFCAVLWMAAVMATMSRLHPETFPPQIELIQFMMLATVLPMVSVLGAQLTAIRNRLNRQKQELTKALERIQQLATRDELTGLFNRRHMMSLLEFHSRQIKRTGAEFCLALLDLDHFKRINDTYGHGVGDMVLRGFAQHAGVILRESDVMARWGGEEFLILFPDTRLDKAELGLRRLRELINDISVAADVPQLRAHFSAGVTECVPGETIQAVIERADQALYAAKARGRNCTVVR